jgi:hypothetical protein
VPDAVTANAWSATEWKLYLESVPRPAPPGVCEALDARFALTQRDNFEVVVAWLALALGSGYLAVVPRVEQVLAAAGRMKFLRLLYAALAADDQTTDLTQRDTSDRRVLIGRRVDSRECAT